LPVLTIELRNKLERTIVEARDVAETGARVVLEALAVHHHEPYGHMSPEQRKLRNHLRARARQLGDKQNRKGELEITHLVWECAYEHWHRMLFARFLAENELLIEPEMGVAISLEECEELAKEDGKDLWTLASEFAQRMLPQIFRPNDPVLYVMFASEHRLKLENLLNDLEPAIFTARDSLGWVYQFWQAKRKKEVNESGNKIGADELPAVTELFTEPYMVNFLIHNTLGAWWVIKVLAENPDIAKQSESEEGLRNSLSIPSNSWEYLRFIKTSDAQGPWQPASGNFDGWPNKVAELKILDPCCGSGHFLVALLHCLVPMRMIEEDLDATEAVDAVLKDNLYALEVDDRCTKLAAFALALAAWSYPNTGGYRTLPKLNIACSGIAPNSKKNEWINLAGNEDRLRNGMSSLYDLFKDAAGLGSLIDPKLTVKANLFKAGFEEMRPLLQEIISNDSEDYESREMGVAAYGILEAFQILDDNYTLVITNVPYLKGASQDDPLKTYCEKFFHDEKSDLATVFLRRCLQLCREGGTAATVTQQYWLFLESYKQFRKNLLKDIQWNYIARLGPGAFRAISGEVVNVCLSVLTKKNPTKNSEFAAIDVMEKHGPDAKDLALGSDPFRLFTQTSQYLNPDSRVTLQDSSDIQISLLNEYAEFGKGTVTGDGFHYLRRFWEVPIMVPGYRRWLNSPDGIQPYSGREYYVLWEVEGHHLKDELGFWQRGQRVYGKKGIAIGKAGTLRPAIYTGEIFDDNVAVICPHDEKLLPALWVYCNSMDFEDNIRALDAKMSITAGTFTKVQFDERKWLKEAETINLPEPHSFNPTQWLFKGQIVTAINPLNVAVARLLGFQWPEQKSDKSEKHSEGGGIVCIPSVQGKEPAAERLRAILAASFCDDWVPSKEVELIKGSGSNAKNIDEWLRDYFFEQHCKLFHHRPFIWHIWDGRRRDGFHALVNYHKLAEGNGKGRQLLENLTYSYLGDWIARQKEGVRRGEGGAEDRLAAALELQKRLIAIIEGEPPFDIFVRWKLIEKQPIGWEPDINDGVRLNIRPFMAQDIPGGRKGAGILRWKPNIKWNKDRGKEPFRPREQYPWFWKDGEFTGDRANDIHLTNEEKRRAREKDKEG